MTMPIPDEKARAWTRPEDYWPPRRLRRSGRSAARRFRRPDEPEKATVEPRPFLDVVPYFALMFGLAVLALAIIAMAWPGRQAQPAPSAPPPAEVGTAPKGWMDSDKPARS